jgi:hypothetical protein
MRKSMNLGTGWSRAQATAPSQGTLASYIRYGIILHALFSGNISIHIFNDDPSFIYVRAQEEEGLYGKGSPVTWIARRVPNRWDFHAAERIWR